MSDPLRERLHQEIDRLPDRVVEKLMNFICSISTEQNDLSDYIDWQNKDWQEFSLEQFFREEDDIEYSLEDTQEIYRP